MSAYWKPITYTEIKASKIFQQPCLLRFASARKILHHGLTFDLVWNIQKLKTYAWKMCKNFKRSDVRSYEAVRRASVVGSSAQWYEMMLHLQRTLLQRFFVVFVIGETTYYAKCFTEIAACISAMNKAMMFCSFHSIREAMQFWFASR